MGLTLASGPHIASGYRGSRRIATLEDFMVMMNEQIKTKMKRNNEQQKMVGPLMWQPIYDQM